MTCRGQVAIFKLSPNLRKHSKGGNTAAVVDAERQKLDAVLLVARKQALAMARCTVD